MPLDCNQQNDDRNADSEGRYLCVWNILENRKQVLNKRSSAEVDAQNLWDLIQYDYQSNSGLKANQNRLGNEIRNKSETQN